MIRFTASLAAVLLLSAPAVAAQDSPQTQGGNEAFAILKEAIEIDTVEGRAKVPMLADRLSARFVAGGFAAEDVSFVPMGETGYLTARYPGRDSSAKPLLVIAHMDVVEADPKDWERDPFTAIVEDGYLFGRGTVDNKGSIAIAMAAALDLKRQGWVPQRDVIFAFSGDEETGMKTTSAMAEALSNAALVLNVDAGRGELAEDNSPMLYAVQAGEKTYADYVLTITDAGGHSSRPGDVDIIADMGAALNAIWQHKFTPQISPLTKAYFEGSAPQETPEIASAMRAFVKDQSDVSAIDTLSASRKYVGVIRTTCVPTMVNGGHARNAMPQSVEANVNCRIFPGTSREEVRQQLIAVMDNPKIDIVYRKSNELESIESPLDPAVMSAITAAVHERAPGIPIIPGMSAGATDSMHFRARGIPAFGVGPIFMRSEDEYAHGLNERIPIATLDPGVKHMEVLLRALAK